LLEDLGDALRRHPVSRHPASRIDGLEKGTGFHASHVQPGTKRRAAAVCSVGDPILPALSGPDGECPGLQFVVGQIERDDLATTKARAVEDREDRRISGTTGAHVLLADAEEVPEVAARERPAARSIAVPSGP
jgi:hypothetical protein